MLWFAGAMVAVLSFLGGLAFAHFASRTKMKAADNRYDELKRDYDIVSAVNVRLLSRITPEASSGASGDTEERFFDLYDDAKRRLHRTLLQHNATAARPIVISRDGANLLQVLAEIPELSFSGDRGEDAGVRAWIRRVIETDIERRSAGKPPAPEAVDALARERAVWAELARD